MTRSTCVFCRIVAGELDAHRVYEDGQNLAFLDLYPLTEGHTLVIPKAHYERFEEMPAAEAGRLFEAVRHVMERIRRALGAPAATIGINNGRAAGQVVPHVHVHVVPRHPGDGGGTIHSIVRRPAQRSLEEVRRLLSS